MNIRRQLQHLSYLVCGLLLLGGVWAAPASAATYYLAPTGANTNAGTATAAPWKTFAHALPKLKPGDTLVLRNGTYTRAPSGYPNIRCGSNAVNGTSGARITLKAENERQAFLKGDGSAYPFYMQNCAYWTIEGLRLESGDFADSSLSNGWVLNVQYGKNVILRRNLARFNNRYKNGAIFSCQNCVDSLVEENEIYSYHRHGFSVYASTNTVFRRNYANSRGYADVPGGFPSAFSTQNGDSGFSFYPASNNLLENNISERNSMGYAHIVSGSMSASNNRHYGNISLYDGSAAFMISGSGEGNPGMAANNIFTNLVSVGSGVGVNSRSGRGNTCTNCTIIGGRTGISADKSTSAPGDGIYSIFGTNVLTVNNSGSGAYISGDVQTWKLNAVNSFGNRTNYSPSSSTNYVNKQSRDPGLGACRVFIPEASPMKRAGLDGKDIGANVLYRYENGVLTSKPLWDVKTGKFPCGAIVPGVNDIPGASCFDVHKRLNVQANGCSLPSTYGQQSVTSTSPQAVRILEVR